MNYCNNYQYGANIVICLIAPTISNVRQGFRNFNWIGLNFLPIINLNLLLEANYDFTVHHPQIVPGK